MNIGKIIGLVKNDKFIITNHARIRMFQRNITTDELIDLIINSEIIENYPDDEPCPSALILGFLKGIPYHIVLAECADHVRIITIYRPEEDKWIDYRTRRKQ